MSRWVLALCVLVGCGADDAGDAEAFVSIDRPGGVIADGTDAVSLLIHVQTSSGKPVVSRAVAVAAPSDVMVDAVVPTDDRGNSTTTLTSTVAGPKTITVNVDGIGPLDPQTIEFVPGPIARLMFLAQPTTSEVGATFSPVQVAVVDAFDNVVTSATNTVTVSLVPSNVLLSGDTNNAASQGVATFDQLAVLVPAAGLTLRASSAPLDSVDSDPFDIIYGEPSSLSTLQATPSSALADGVSEVSLLVTLRNSAGVAIPNYPVTLTSSGTGNVLYPTASGMSDSQGRFGSAMTSTVAEPKMVTATAGSLVLTSSVTFLTAPCTPRLPGIPSHALSNDVMSAMLVRDVNNDGHLDLAILEGSSLAIMRGVGNGTFHAPLRLPAGSNAVSLAAADFDHDGDIDFVSAARYTKQLSIYLNQGNGVFVSGAKVVTIEEPLAVEAADFDADGNVDLVMRSGLSVWLQHGNGNGTFQAPAQYPLGVPQFSVTSADIAIGTFNADARPDVITMDSQGYYTVLLGTSTGTLQTLPSAQSTGGNPGRIAVADFDGDSKLDVVLSRKLLRGNGDGTFGTGVTIGEAGRVAAGAFAADLNADGKQDIVLAASGGGPSAAEVLLGNGDGTFATPQWGVINGFMRVVAAGDFDEDGYGDVVAAMGNYNSALPTSVSVLRGTASGIISTQYAKGMYARFFNVVGDFDGNGTLDFVTEDSIYHQLRIQLADAAGTLTAMPMVSGSASTPIAAKDFDADGRIDVLATGGQGLRWYKGNGDGTLQPYVETAIPGGYTISPSVADLNGDGVDDVAVANPTGNTVTIAFGVGNGTWSGAAQYPIGMYPQDLEIADLDADGDRDLVVVNRNSSTIGVLKNNGNGTYAAHVAYPVSGAPWSLTIGDFDGDAKPDVVVGKDSTTLGFLKGNGNGTLQAETAIPVGIPSRQVEAVDIDTDGDLDVLSSYGSLLVIRGMGDGTFFPPLIYDSGYFNPLVRDFNGDNRRDVMFSGDDTASGFTLMTNNGCM